MKRVKKIKSKLFHKLKKHQAESETKKLLEELDEIDPEAASAFREKQEQKRVEERILMRHNTKGKYAKNLKRFKGMNDEGAAEEYKAMIDHRDELKRKTKQTNRMRDAGESDSESDGSIEDKI